MYFEIEEKEVTVDPSSCNSVVEFVEKLQTVHNNRIEATARGEEK